MAARAVLVDKTEAVPLQGDLLNCSVPAVSRISKMHCRPYGNQQRKTCWATRSTYVYLDLFAI